MRRIAKRHRSDAIIGFHQNVEDLDEHSRQILIEACNTVAGIAELLGERFPIRVAVRLPASEPNKYRLASADVRIVEPAKKGGKDG